VYAGGPGTGVDQVGARAVSTAAELGRRGGSTKGNTDERVPEPGDVNAPDPETGEEERAGAGSQPREFDAGTDGVADCFSYSGGFRRPIVNATLPVRVRLIYSNTAPPSEAWLVCERAGRLRFGHPATEELSMSSPESDLVTRAVHADQEAIGRLLAQIRPAVVRYCRARLGRLGGAYTTADDVAQDVCLAVLRALPRFQQQEGRPFAAFIYRIAANKVADAQRVGSRRAALPVDVLNERPDRTPGPEQQVMAEDLARRLSALLAHLPEIHREIVVLRVAVGLTAEEVGRVLTMSPAAVRVAQSRALAHLRTLARNQFDEVRA
jgi:RNA polymerase sigma-70 factor (ECF subfamily)